jgi:phosphotransferase system HPr (HPr) family protein
VQSNIFTIQNEVGLHARPAALFVQTVAKFKAKVKVRNATRHSSPVDAKSIISVLGLGVARGHEIEVVAEGEDEQAAVEAVTRLIENDFAEASRS